MAETGTLGPPPPSPAGPLWPPSRRWGAPLCLRSCSQQACECSRAPNSGGGMGSSRMSHSLLPVSQLFEALRVSRQAGVSPSESDQLLHFASNGQLCGGTEWQPHSPMATRLLLGNSHWGSAGTAPLRGVGVAWPEGLWNGAQNYSDTFHLCFFCSLIGGVQINDCPSCFQI